MARSLETQNIINQLAAIEQAKGGNSGYVNNI